MNNPLIRFFQSPTKVSRSELRLYLVVFYGNLMALLLHVSWTILFFTYDIPPLAYYNLISIGFWLLSIMVLRKSALIRTILIADTIEIVIHQIFAIYYLGWEYGFQFYIMFVIMFIFVGGFRKLWIPISYGAICVIIILLAYLLSFEHIPAYSLDLRVQKALYSFTIIGFALITAIFSYLYSTAASKAESDLMEKNVEVQKQKDQIQEKNEEIEASLYYAKRIQNATLPPQENLLGNFKDSFILFKPKDIVSGDFYWVEVSDIGVDSKNHESQYQSPKPTIYFAAADCTGHGVPGAMVSVMCSHALTKAVKEEQIKEPAKILDKSVELLGKQMTKSDEGIKDGMDLGLCRVDMNEGKPNEKGQLQYAGANNPLYMIRNNEIHEIKADKQGVGKQEDIQPFTNHVIDLQKGDQFYVFSDGYPDQFGGPKGKKFKYKPFKKLLLENCNKSMKEQKQILEENLNNWMEGYEQVDDICVIGIKV
ncbi:MAG: PP2C family protein-serine/threonine phosphatase [Flavobacteriales bacterium]